MLYCHEQAAKHNESNKTNLHFTNIVMCAQMCSKVASSTLLTINVSSPSRQSTSKQTSSKHHSLGARFTKFS